MQFAKETISMAEYDEKLKSELRYIVFGEECSSTLDGDTKKDIEEDASYLQRLLEQKFEELFGPFNNDDSCDVESE